MLELKGIKKDYAAGENTVHALKGIDLKFRNHEFVSILGPSGCGKTTMLNIIGGLDQYTEGDLIINGRSTKDFKDKDWDTYRNHSIGFVFQSYNLIPHQTVLQNVELALTLSGVSKAERKKRAKKALEEVGLGNQLNKKPSQMSGGQMQRVSIARALVNNPDIILADEPTGALDTKTSIQVMEILKEVSKDRLVIMVTHNPELAEKYSTRIIRMLDGSLTDDSVPLTEKEVQLEQVQDQMSQEQEKDKKKPSMSFGTSFLLSLKNLITKKGRTALTSFAGSIGIIGIALVYAVSQGFTEYIDDVQENALSSYPLTIEKTNTDLSAITETFMGQTNDNADHENNAVYENSSMYNIVETFNNLDSTENDLKSFKSHIDSEYADNESELHKALNGVQYSYDLDLLVYTENVDGTIIPSDVSKLLTNLLMEYMNIDMTSMQNLRSNSSIMNLDNSPMSSMGGISVNVWQEMLSGDNGDPVNDILKKQYDVVYGTWPSKYDEVVLVLDENNELDDTTLYALGLESEEEMGKIITAAMDGTKLEEKSSQKWSYEEICNMEFKTILNSDCYSYDEKTGLYTDLRETDAGLKYLYDNALPLKVSGIIRPNEDAETTMLSGSIGYTSDLTKYVIENSHNSDVIKAQLDDPSNDIFTGLPFHETTGDLTDEEKNTEFNAYLDSLDDKSTAAVYVQMMSIPTEEQLDASVKEAMNGMTRSDMETSMTQALTDQMGMSESDVSDYIADMSDEEITDSFTQMMAEQVKVQYAQQVQEQMSTMTPEELAAGFQHLKNSLTAKQGAVYYDSILEFSDSTYEDNLSEMGYVDLDDPSAINLYASSFANKDVITDEIENYNNSVEEIEQIQYTDYIGLMMSSITTIINTITYVLIAFVAISLIVSSIMIGVITLISVQERTKEIGILRAIGASKREVCSMFNAETIIIGLISGVFGVALTYILCIPINAVIHSLTGINNLSAFLPIPAAIVLILVSVALTLLSGLIPSRSAAKKDPVVALRTE